ncbi:MAG: SLC13 family permease [Myxococcota bacterium]
MELPLPADVLAVFGLVILALVLFAWRKVRVDATAILVMAMLMLSGILEPEQALRGFSNVATVTVAAMFVLSAGLRQTGALERISELFGRIGRRNHWLALGAMMATVASVSAFINNTAAVAIFIPVVITLARQLGLSPSKLLMPLSFASMFGGVCTLIGTSTNLLVSSIAEDHDMAPFGLFEFAPLGLVFVVAGGVYLFAAQRFIPRRRPAEPLSKTFEVKEFLTDVELGEGAPLVGERACQALHTLDLDLEIVEVYRDGESFSGGALHRLRVGDVLRIRGAAEEIAALHDEEGISLRPSEEWADEDIATERDALVEAVIAPNSELTGRTIGDVHFNRAFGAQVLAIRQHGRVRYEDLRRLRLSGGNSLLLKIDRERLPHLEQNRHFVVVSEVVTPRLRKARMPWALGIVAAVVALAAFGIVPIVESAVGGCLALVMTGCLSGREVYEAIQWKVIFLLAGILSLGVAMEETGAARLLADAIVGGLEPLGGVAIVSAFFLLSQVLTAVISNNATAVLLAPIAIGTADQLGVDARPFLMAVTFAASCSFMTPIGYQTNTLIYGPGEYRFTDFTRIGGPLNILFWILATLLIPVIWPL